MALMPSARPRGPDERGESTALLPLSGPKRLNGTPDFDVSVIGGPVLASCF
jgi:hypothetical protein